jgi:hypothetical protein
MSWFIETLTKILLSPKQFFSDMPKGGWNEEPLTFTLICGWIMAFALTLVVFINSYVPTGLSLIEGIYGKKLIIVVPVLGVMGFAFFAMTLLIIAGLLIIGLIALFFFCAVILDLILILLGGSSNIYEVFKAALYMNAVVLAGLINIFLMIPVKFKLLPFPYWIALENLVFYLASLYLFYMFALAGQSTHKVSGWRAFLAATVPFVILVLANIVLSHKILPRLAGFLG